MSAPMPRERGLAIEEAARDLRYAFLFSQARRHAAHAVAVGHTADDQVETVLMHLVRGAGIAGLKGMSYRTILDRFDGDLPLVRPLLGTWRGDTFEYCRVHSLDVIHDPSNNSLEHTRNQVRHELIPALESYNPRVRQAIWRTAHILASDLALLEEHVGEAWRRAALGETHSFVCFDPGQLAECSVALRRRLVRLAARRLKPDLDIGFAALQRGVDFIDQGTPGLADLGGGVTLYREPDAIYVCLDASALPVDAWPQLQQPVAISATGGPLQLSLDRGWRFTAEFARPTADFDAARLGASAYLVYLDADSLPSALELRTPRPGDRIQPLGLQGHSQKLSDVFVNARTPGQGAGSLAAAVFRQHPGLGPGLSQRGAVQDHQRDSPRSPVRGGSPDFTDERRPGSALGR